MSELTIVTNKPEYIFAVSGIVVKFVGTEVELYPYQRKYHYEDAVKIIIDNRVVGVVYHKKDENLFSLDFLSKEKHQAILDAHEELLKCLENDNRMHNPFDKDVEEAVREFVRKYGRQCSFPHLKDFIWKPYHCDAIVTQVSILAESDTKKLTIIIQLSKKHKQEIYRYSHMVLGIDSNGAVYKKQRDINLIDWRAEFGMV